jgi:hypothetical protein
MAVNWVMPVRWNNELALAQRNKASTPSTFGTTKA